MIHWRRRRMMNIFKTPTLWLKPLNNTNIIQLLHCEVRVKDASQAPKFVPKCNFMGIHNDWWQWTTWRRQTGCWICTAMNPQHQQREQTVSQTSARGGNQPDTIHSCDCQSAVHFFLITLMWTTWSLVAHHNPLMSLPNQWRPWSKWPINESKHLWWNKTKGWAWTLQQGVWTLDKQGVFFPDYSAMLQFSAVQNGLYTPAKAQNYVQCYSLVQFKMVSTPLRKPIIMCNVTV